MNEPNAINKEITMQIYKVGGAVRDELLNHPVTERDWVVVGATPQQMRDLGYKQVGKDFPVFLHPDTGEEYALARTERKVGQGYTGFEFNTASDITLEQDLQRRDLTINAMAQDDNGQLIDPYGGYNDLQNRLLRHVSSAFEEDPLRVLRIARFAARLPDFEIADETLQLMQRMVASGELNALVAERVWQEWYKALKTHYPARFFEVLQACGALQMLMPELLEQHYDWQSTLNYAAQQTLPAHIDPASDEHLPLRFASMVVEVKNLQQLGQTWRIPKAYIELAQTVHQHYPTACQNHDANSLLQWINNMDGIRRLQRLQNAVWVMQCYWRHDTQAQQNLQLLQQAAQLIQPITARSLNITHIPGPQIPDKLNQARLQAIQSLLQNHT